MGERVTPSASRSYGHVRLSPADLRWIEGQLVGGGISGRRYSTRQARDAESADELLELVGDDRVNELRIMAIGPSELTVSLRGTASYLSYQPAAVAAGVVEAIERRLRSRRVWSTRGLIWLPWVAVIAWAVAVAATSLPLWTVVAPMVLGFAAGAWMALVGPVLLVLDQRDHAPLVDRAFRQQLVVGTILLVAGGLITLLIQAATGG